MPPKSQSSRRPSAASPRLDTSRSRSRAGNEFLVLQRTHEPLEELFSQEELRKLPTLAVPRGRLRAAPAPHHELYTNYQFPVAGQGTIQFQLATSKPFRIVLSDQQKQSEGRRPVLVLEVGPEGASFRQRNNDASEDVLASTDAREARLEPGVERLYWFSLDKKNRRLRFGKGYMQEKLRVFEYTLPPFKKVDPFAWTQELRYIALCGDLDVNTIQHELWPLPVTVSLPPFVVRDEQVTLENLARGDVTVVENLPPECQRLYANVAGPRVTLDTEDFPDFSKAIEYSINTPGRLCFERLEEKASEFGKKDPQATYLRVTLGEDQGNSPGVPFVLEIWPAGHYSPIHSHSNSFAVIKVLHGSITAELYPELELQLHQQYWEAQLQEGHVTWLAPQAYQTHRLNNKGDSMCATIQCYQYGQDDQQHYEYFDYIDGSGAKISQFKPNTDWDFLEFKRLIRAEWEGRKPSRR